MNDIKLKHARFAWHVLESILVHCSDSLKAYEKRPWRSVVTNERIMEQLHMTIIPIKKGINLTLTYY